MDWILEILPEIYFSHETTDSYVQNYDRVKFI